MATRMEINRAERAALEADRAGTYEERRSRLNAWFRVACTGVGADHTKLVRHLKLRDFEIHLTSENPWSAWADRERAHVLASVQGVQPPTWFEAVPAYTRSLDAARAFVAGTLPGFWVSSGLCALTGHASIGADYNGPDGERLHREWPTDRTPCDWSEDLAPGGGPHHECMAILACAVRALAHKLQLEASA